MTDEISQNSSNPNERLNAIASGGSSHAEGCTTRALGYASHAEGASSAAFGDASHAEGVVTLSQETGAHAEGNHTYAQGKASHAEGTSTKANGFSAHSEGFGTIASGNFSHAEGISTNTKELNGAHIMGRFGSATTPYSWHLANGISAKEQGLAARIQADGFGALDAGWSLGGIGYAEAFETIDRRPIEPGYFVTLDGKKVKRVDNANSYLLGITCAAPAVLTNSGELRWKDKYLTDEWGRIKYHEVKVSALVDESGHVLVPEHTELQPMLNPKWDTGHQYIPRLNRPEWVAVTIFGRVLVRDDGTCQVNGYCRSNDLGVATPCRSSAFRVMERISSNQILVMAS